MKRTILLIFTAVALISCAREPGHVKVLAHRGFCSTGSEFTTDENTLDALKRAQQKGVDAVEFDVHLTADSALVIRHDNRIAPGLTCQGSTLEEIRAHTLPFGNRIPTLREWLEQAKKTPQVLQMLEIKAHPGEGEKTVIAKSLEIIRELDMLDQMYMLSFKSSTLDEVLRQEPKMKVILNSSDLHHSMSPAEVKEHGYTAVSYNIGVILNHPEWIEEFRKDGVETFLWMVNCTYLRGLAEDLGFTWVTTDFYDIVGY